MPLWVEVGAGKLIGPNAREKAPLPPERWSQRKENSLASKCWLDNSFHILLCLDGAQGPGLNSKTFSHRASNGTTER